MADETPDPTVAEEPVVQDETPPEETAEVPENPEVPPDAETEEEAGGEAPGETPPQSDAEEGADPTQKPAEQAPQLHEVKVNGEVRKYTLEDLKKKASLVDGANAKFQEAAALKDAAVHILQSLPQDPIGVLMDVFTGTTGNPQQAYAAILDVCKKFVIRDYKRKNMPEPERRALELQEENERLRSEAEARTRKDEAAALEYRTAQETQRVLGQMAPALKAAGLPQDEDTVADVAQTMLNLRIAGEDPTIQEAVQEYQRILASRRQVDIRALPIDELLKVRPDVAEEVRKRNLTTTLAQRRQRPAAAPKPAAPAAGPRAISSADFIDAVRGR